jgi:hypothetical protein
LKILPHALGCWGLKPLVKVGEDVRKELAKEALECEDSAAIE